MAGAWALALVWSACVLSLAAQAQTRPQPSDADADLHPLAFEGGTRQYLLRLPPGPPADPKGWPLVVVFHGGGGDALNAERMTGFTALGRREGFAVLYPQGTPAAGQRLGTWPLAVTHQSACNFDASWREALHFTAWPTKRVILLENPTRVISDQFVRQFDDFLVGAIVDVEVNFFG